MGRPKRLSTHAQGKKAEVRAALYLRMKGYRVLETNFRVAQGEIDLIVTRGGVLAFVEVKSRKGSAQGTPLEAVSPHKVRRLSAAAAVYLASHPEGPQDCRFDILTLGPEKNLLGLPKVRHFQNAFPAEGSFNI